MAEHRRQAVMEVRSGSAVAEVAIRYGASRQSVYNRKARFEQDGVAGLTDRGVPGIARSGCRPRSSRWCASRAHARIRAVGERANTTLRGRKCWSSCPAVPATPPRSRRPSSSCTTSKRTATQDEEGSLAPHRDRLMSMQLREDDSVDQWQESSPDLTIELTAGQVLVLSRGWGTTRTRATPPRGAPV
jgi:hypothetical protein